jgi:hypothetical protein
MRTCERCGEPTPFPTGPCENCWETDLATQRRGRAPQPEPPTPPPEPPKPSLVRCRFCQRFFAPAKYAGTVLLCSDRCRRFRRARLAANRKAEQRQPKTCRICGRTFLPPDLRALCCSPACKQERCRRVALANYYRRQYRTDITTFAL